MNTSVENIFREGFYNSSIFDPMWPNIVQAKLSDPNRQALALVRSFGVLNDNWDTYGAMRPSDVAIQKASSFIVWLSDFNIDVFFIAPSPDGDILVELKQEDANLEFEFTGDSCDTVSAIQNEEFINEAEINETTLIAYIKWLICPDGGCPPNL